MGSTPIDGDFVNCGFSSKVERRPEEPQGLVRFQGSTLRQSRNRAVEQLNSGTVEQ
jgi:hypothetical protein